MAVNTQSPTWARYAYERGLIADLVEGKATAVKHIPDLPGWIGGPIDPATGMGKGDLVRERAYYLPMVPRTIETFGGLVFLKAPRRVFPEGFDAMTADVTGSGQEIDRFAEACLDDVLGTGGLAILTDYEPVPEGMSKAEAEKQGYRPHLSSYDANTVLDARLGKVGGATKVVLVRLLEQIEEDRPTPGDPFATEFVEQVRVLRLEDGVYTQQVYRQEKGEWIAGEITTPLKNGAPLDEIPIDFSNGRDGQPFPLKPAVADLAECSKSHLTNSASYEWTLSWLGEPILFGAGFKADQAGGIEIGASTAVINSSHEAKLSIVSLGAEGVDGLAKAMAAKERHAAALGARLLAEDPKAAITAETARIQRAGETSVVGAAANSVSQCITNALKRLADWAGFPTEVATKRANGDPLLGPDGAPVVNEMLYWLNTEIIPKAISHEEVSAMLALVLAGKMTDQEFYAKLQEAEWVDAGKAYEDHAEEAAEMDVNTEPDEEEVAAAGGERKE